MNRLQAQWQRLFLAAGADGLDAAHWCDAQGQVRALVLELARPADWSLMARVWRGVQADLQWPAPAIAVSGVDGYQLWFALRSPVSVDQAQACLKALCARYLPEVAPQRLRQWPELDATAPGGVRHAGVVPALHQPEGVWSAFVAPDLAPVFVDTPWLDIPPGADGQADLLAQINPIAPDDWARALAGLLPAPAPAQMATPPGPPTTAVHLGGTHTDPERFLLDVMNNEAVDLALRIEAAKALLSARSQGDDRPSRS